MVYRVALANESSYDLIHQAFFADRRPYLRRVSPDELRTIIGARSLWEVTEAKSEEVVAVCYVRDFFTPRRAEFGGLNVKDAHQRTGLATALCVLAVTTFLWLNRDSREHAPILTYVHVDNERPRKLLKSIGFVQSPGVFQVDPVHVLGIDQLPTVARSRHEFILPASEYSKIFRLAADYLMNGRLEKHHRIESHLAIGLTAEGLLSLC
jgi:GNAT superfamily N-acetyltransferase